MFSFFLPPSTEMMNPFSGLLYCPHDHSPTIPSKVVFILHKTQRRHHGSRGNELLVLFNPNLLEIPMYPLLLPIRVSTPLPPSSQPTNSYLCDSLFAPSRGSPLQIPSPPPPLPPCPLTEFISEDLHTGILCWSGLSDHLSPSSLRAAVAAS